MLRRTVGDVAYTHPLLSLPPQASVRDAARLMKRDHVASVYVPRAGRDPAGIFTERDLTDRVVAEGLDPDRTTLAQVMSPAPAMIAVGATVAEALRLMFVHAVRHLPVIAANGQVVAMVSMRDFLGTEVADMDRARSLAEEVTEVL
ncbi:MAG: CBS domain-containing protein [Azospirillaceae bacterium]|nr:CBS domain-containing protein [Azospirillaceae bacterium]